MTLEVMASGAMRHARVYDRPASTNAVLTFVPGMDHFWRIIEKLTFGMIFLTDVMSGWTRT